MSLRELFGLFMPLFYIVVGVILLAADASFQAISRYRPVLGGLLLGYGLLRAFLLWRKHRIQRRADMTPKERP